MKVTTAERLNEIMQKRGLRQADVLRLVEPFSRFYGIPVSRSNISMYCSGRVVPAQDKLFVLACALDVSEAWLMGVDVPESREPQAQRIAESVVELMHLETGTQILLADVLKKPAQRARLLSYAETLRALDAEKTEGGD